MESRLNKYLSEIGYCSRREADRLIEQGRVMVNNHIAVVGEKILLEDDNDIIINGKKVVAKKQECIIMVYNKPIGVECTADKKNKDNIIDAIGYNKRLIYMGRLDKNSRGLILLTTEGELVNKLMRGANYKEKEYIVSVNKKINDSFINKMSKGVKILDTITRPCKVWKMDDNTFGIILTQGLNRQIRRMCKALNYEVLDLKRVRIESVTLGNLKEGEYRLLSEEEIKELKKGLD